MAGSKTLWIIRCVETGEFGCHYGTYEEAVEKAQKEVAGTGNTYVIA